MTGEIIENAVRNGKIDAGENFKRPTSRKKEGEVNNVSTYNKGYSNSITVGSPRMVATSHQGPPRQESNSRAERPQFTPIPITYRELITGNLIENCTAFKKVVERLIKMGIVKLDDPSGPNVAGNPLPDHTDKGVNVIAEDGSKKIKADVMEVRTPMKCVWEQMVCRGLITRDLLERPKGAGMYLFKTIVQNLMDNKEIEFYEEFKEFEEREVCASKERPVERLQKINHPVDKKKVPWNYDCNVTIPGERNLINASVESNDNGFYTCSGRRYDLATSKAEPIKEKAPVVERKKEKAVRLESPVNEPVTESEAREFLKFLKHSEYSVIEQLRKQPTRISVLTLLLSSEVHRNALMKVLNETYVANDISVNKLDRMVGNISADNFIFFNDDEIPSRGMGSTKALHITTHCKGYTLLGVLIDNGSSLNVLPLSTLNRLPVDSSRMKTCQNIVKVFDGTERRVMGRIEIPLLIGPSTYEVDFLVMDIKPSYNCLLGRPWIHSAGAVPSSLHQKLKLVTEGRLVTINVDKDIIAAVTSDAPYVGTEEEAIECSFRSLEFVNATFIVEGNKIPTPKISKTTRMGLQMMAGRGALPGKKTWEITPKEGGDGQIDGLDAKQKRKEVEKKQERRKARLSGEETKWEPMTFPHISKTFVSGGTIHPERRTPRKGTAEGMLGDLSINAISEEEIGEEKSSCIRPYEPGSVLNNWTAEEILVTFKVNSE
ncbi:uncharacterized protein LOC105793260 [Gossypium raimondii]|uniref:uncharacterized protein LOC105793260 n=1 Tax=Gossypium raimondii TaxID=29730 RepID=UPI00063AC640|nr:uncharacterized protein LOC105793260 [Gossypium raimondii]